MKHISLVVFLFTLSWSALAQEVVFDTAYYAPPPVVRKRVLTADPDQRPSTQYTIPRQQTNVRREWLKRFSETQTWYVSAEGGLRNDISQLSNTLNQLISSPSQAKFAWSILLGYTYHNAWSIETGYTQAPIHLTISIANGSDPLVYNYQNNGYGLPLRIRRRIGLGKRSDNGTGFWLTGGAWLVPNGNGQTGDFRLIGYQRYNRSRVDTLRLNSLTTITKRVTGMAELGIDYTTRLSSALELGFYARKYWGLGNALQADVAYTVNSTAKQVATITANGSGWGFGIVLRYIYGKQQELKIKSSQNELYR